MSGGVAAPAVARRRRSARAWIAGGIAAAIIATIAVIANGYDARETPRAEPGVWVARDAGQYARVNTDTGEIDTVRRVESPSGLVQTGDRSAVLTHGNGRAWPVDAAAPVDLGGDEGAGAGGSGGADGADDAETVAAEDAADAGAGAAGPDGAGSGGADAGAVNLPEGTRDVVTSGGFVGVRTESGQVFAGPLTAAPEESAPQGAMAGGASGTGGAGGASGAGAGTIAAEARASELAGRLAALTGVDPRSAEAEDAAEAAESETAAEAGADQGAADSEAGSEPAEPGTESAEASDGEAAFSAAAIALAPDGALAVYDAGSGSVWRYDAAAGEFSGGADELPEAAHGIENPQLAIADGRWALLDPSSGALYLEGGESAALDLAEDPRLQASGASDGVFVADVAGLLRVGSDGVSERVADADGVPAQPIVVDDEIAAAWLGQERGALWTGEGETVSLQFDDSVDSVGDVTPVFRTNGERAVLSEVGTGMLWTVPDGTMIPLSQWDISDPPKEDQGVVEVEEVTEQVPPTAVDDAFGVRPGESAPLPVLLNDFDANQRDVLTIVPESLEKSPLPEEFGAVQLLPDGQGLTVQAAEDASGSASFSYQVTDGKLTSETATVTLTIAADDANSAPEWCPVEGCQREWGIPAIAPGGTLIAPVLDGWVDPEGDVMMLAGASVRGSGAPVSAIVTGDGRLAVRHTDPNAGPSETTLEVTVRDGRGEESTRELTLEAEPEAPPVFPASASTVQVGETTELRPLERVAGGSGAFEVTDAAVRGSGSSPAITPRTDTGVVEVTPEEEGVTDLALTVRDVVTGVETTGTVRVTAIPTAPPLSLPPLRAYVRPLSDAVVDVLHAVPGASTRPLSVAGAEAVDGEVQADVIEHGRVRIAGSTADGGAGRAGAVDVTVAEGDARAQSRLTVFQVPESDPGGAVAVTDTATVRAGHVVDIPVLDNDVSAVGDRLLLDPEVVGSGTKGELAFASGSTLRYLAPQTPGTYRLSYTAYSSSDPGAGDVGTVLVTVRAEGSNRDPVPAALTARVAPDETVEVRVPLSGVDPDGDRVRLDGVDAADDARITATVGGDGSSVSVSAAGSAPPGVHEVEYAVRDAAGGEGTGLLRIIVADAGGQGRAPVAATDHVRLRPGGDAITIRPLDNDADPARGTLSITAVEPNVPGGSSAAESRRLAELLDTDQLSEGRIGVTPGDETGTVSYRYTVRSSETSSTSTGLIVVHTSERVGTQAPAVTDTVLAAGDREQLEDGGIDVVSGKVRWATGDPEALELSLWGSGADRYRIDDGRIRGDYDPEGDQVVFRLTGADASGETVTTYGLLVVPPLDELRLTLKPDIRPLSVDEGGSAEMQVPELVQVGSDDRVELRQGAYRVGRSQATCTPVSGETVRYAAGKGAPWQDVCVIDARLAGQQRWTSLPVPVEVVPEKPVAELNALTRTVAPGASETIDLADMVVWRGDRDGSVSDLSFDVSGGGQGFETSLSGASLSVEARADATPGRQQAMTVHVRGAGESRGTLTLRVGTAPRDLPRGATVSLQCTVGSDCRADVVGVAGEHDPFAGGTGGGLRLVSVNSGSCSVGDFSRQGDRGVRVSWPGERITGGTCTVGFTVRDAQDRVGEGTIEFDAQGVPEAPASIAQTGYDATSATFTVTLGSRTAHPEVSGVELSGAGSTSCTARGASVYQCVASGLRGGEKHRFTARAVNSVGRSAPSNAVTAWAYESPSVSSVSATAVKNPDNTDQGRGGVRISVSGSSSAASFRVSLGGSVLGTISGPEGSATYQGIPVGGQTFTVVPVTRHEVPSIGGSPTGAAAQASVSVIGAPRLSGATLESTGPTSARVSMQGFGGHAGESVAARYAIGGPGGGSPGDCATGQSSPDFGGLKQHQNYRAVACAVSDYGITKAETGVTRVGGRPGVPGGDLTYAIATAPSGGGASASYGLVREPAPTAVEGATLQYRIDGAPADGFAVSPARVSDIAVRQCIDTSDEASCSDWAKISPAPGTAPAPVTVEPSGECYTGTGDRTRHLSISEAARPFAAVTAGERGESTVPLTVRWSGPFKNLEPATVTVCAEPEPAP